MKHSINTKLLLYFALLVLMIITTVWLLNTLVLEDYYILNQKKSLESLYLEINKLYNGEDDTATIESALEVFDSKKNIDILVQNEDGMTLYSTSRDFTRNRFFINDMASPFSLQSEPIPNGEQYEIIVINDDKIQSDFILLRGILNNGFNIFIRTPMESVKDSIKITNQFLVYVGIFVTIIAGIISFFIAKSFTKPIKELDHISQKMSQLDFSQKYEVKSNDEIGTLGTSINTLSANLEKTIQELKNTNMELEKDIEETSKLSEMRSKFISDVSHELKTPIALIQGYAEGLSDGIVTDEESKKYYCDVILDEANKMAELTRGLLDLSNLEYGKNELHLQDFNMTELIKELVRKQEILLKEKGINISFDASKDVFVVGDTFRIEQVLNNYLSNAIKNVDEHKKIQITLTKTENHLVRIGVFNTGNPIEEEDMMKIWERLYKADKSRNRDAGGSGIGLSLVKAIMKQHHQNYGCQNEKNGVTFWFELQEAKKEDK